MGAAPISAINVVQVAGPHAKVAALPVVAVAAGYPVAPDDAQAVVPVSAGSYPVAPVAPVPVVFKTAGTVPLGPETPIPVVIIVDEQSGANSSNTGFTSAPGYPGSLTPAGSIASGNTYDYLDFPSGMTLTSLNNITFNGCRFQSNATLFANVRLTNCTNIVFNYCSFVPLVSLQPSPTHPGAWPSAGVGGNIDWALPNAYQIPGANGYQYGIRLDGATGTGGVVIDHCDIWGFGNAIDLAGALSCTVRDTWIHDAGNGPAAPNDYHHDGVGYLDGGGGRSNILVQRCTIASLGNTNGIAFQAASSAYSNITVEDCYLSGFGYCVDMCHLVAGNNNLKFRNNTLATDVRWIFGPLYANFSSQFNLANPTNLWSGNKLKVYPGTTPGPSATFSYTAADNGKFIHPSGALSATDWVPS